MSTSVTFSAKGLGAVAILNDENKIVGGGAYGPGFDGQFRTLEFQDGDGDGTFDVYQPSGKADATDWPQQAEYTRTRIGTAMLEMSADRNTLSVVYNLDRYALGWPKADFSPAPPRGIEGTVTMSRLA